MSPVSVRQQRQAKQLLGLAHADALAAQSKALNTLITTSGDPATQRFLQRLSAMAATADVPGWQRLVLAQPRSAAPTPQRVVVRPLLLRGQACLSFVYSHATQDITKNLPVAEGLAQVAELLATSFRHAHLFAGQEQSELRVSKKGQGHLNTQAVTPTESATSPTHDRQKQRALSLDRPFLTALGITTAQHTVVPAMARKWKQINKFIEVFAHALAASPLADAQTLHVVDFGAGRAYLSFALHDWLRHTQNLRAEVTAVELRPDLVQEGQQTIAALNMQGMHMRQGDVRDWAATTSEPMDVMIALHACDTATDHAIHLGLQAGAQIIMCSPCCHKEVRPQLLSPHPLRSVFQHGIHAEQQAEMLTDSLRALLLEAQGYDTQVFEFVTLEHTRKNKMILAVKRRTPQPAAVAAALVQVEELKRYFGVREQRLEMLLLGETA
jgi:Methyltransferase domain